MVKSFAVHEYEPSGGRYEKKLHWSTKRSMTVVGAVVCIEPRHRLFMHEKYSMFKHTFWLDINTYLEINWLNLILSIIAPSPRTSILDISIINKLVQYPDIPKLTTNKLTQLDQRTKKQENNQK